MSEGREKQGGFVADVDHDILKIAVVNRYADARPAVGFVRGFVHEVISPSRNFFKRMPNSQVSS